MSDDPTQIARAAAASVITAKRDALVAERTELIERRTEILSRLRRLDRELSDCRAAARLFDLQIEFPPDEREEVERAFELRTQRERLREQESLLAAARARLSTLPVEGEERLSAATRRAISASLSTPLQMTAATSTSVGQTDLSVAATSARAAIVRPPLREILLDQLKIAGPTGSKAAPLRDYIERTYGSIVHEKTVGMTLYRLLKENLVRRDGHIWFFGPPSEAGPKNPGAGTPGSDSGTTEKGDQHHVAHGR